MSDLFDEDDLDDDLDDSLDDDFEDDFEEPVSIFDKDFIDETVGGDVGHWDDKQDISGISPSSAKPDKYKRLSKDFSLPKEKKNGVYTNMPRDDKPKDDKPKKNYAFGSDSKKDTNFTPKKSTLSKVNKVIPKVPVVSNVASKLAKPKKGGASGLFKSPPNGLKPGGKIGSKPGDKPGGRINLKGQTLKIPKDEGRLSPSSRKKDPTELDKHASAGGARSFLNKEKSPIEKKASSLKSLGASSAGGFSSFLKNIPSAGGGNAEVQTKTTSIKAKAKKKMLSFLMLMILIILLCSLAVSSMADMMTDSNAQQAAVLGGPILDDEEQKALAEAEIEIARLENEASEARATNASDSIQSSYQEDTKKVIDPDSTSDLYAGAADGGGQTSVTGVTKRQLENYSLAYNEAVESGLTEKGVKAVIMVIIAESRGWNLANDGSSPGLRADQPAESLKKSMDHPQSDGLPKDRGVAPHGGDHGSVGLVQQQWPWWGTIDELMNRKTAVQIFIKKFKETDYNNMDTGLAIQSVQRSFDATGSNYNRESGLADSIIKEILAN